MKSEDLGRAAIAAKNCRDDVGSLKNSFRQLSLNEKSEDLGRAAIAAKNCRWKGISPWRVDADEALCEGLGSSERQRV